MILLREYNEEKRLDRVWYDSSNVFYSECEDGDTVKKVLRVVFKNGATYQYSDVDVNDYIMFIAGGADNSNGKALNEFVKKKNCPYVKLENADKDKLIKEMNDIKEQRRLAALELLKDKADKQETTEDENKTTD